MHLLIGEGRLGHFPKISKSILSLELSTVDLSIRSQKPRVRSHFGSLGMGVSPGASITVLYRTNNEHLLNHIIIFPAALFHSLFDGIVHGTVSIRKASAFHVCFSVSKNPFHNAIIIYVSPRDVKHLLIKLILVLELRSPQ